MPRTPKYSLYDSLGYLAYQASGSIRKHISRGLAEKGYPIKAEQFSILVYIRDEDGQSQSTLAKKIYRNKTAVTRLLAPIEALGLIERRPEQVDGREKRVFLTEEGKSLMSEATQLVQRILQRAQKGISSREMATCKDVLRSVRQNLS